MKPIFNAVCVCVCVCVCVRQSHRFGFWRHQCIPVGIGFVGQLGAALLTLYHINRDRLILRRDCPFYDGSGSGTSIVDLDVHAIVPVFVGA